MRGSSRILPSRASFSTPSTSQTWYALQIRAIVFGPSPWIFSRSSIEGLYFLSRSVWTERRPSLNISCKFASMPLPMPGISSTFFGSLIKSAICCGRASIGLRGVAVRANAKRILPVDFEQVSSFVEDAGDGFVVHLHEG